MLNLLKALKAYGNPQTWVKNITWRFARTVSATPAIFVVGAPRSGTTLLQRILTVHSQTFALTSETGLFTKQNIFDPRRTHFGLAPAELQQLFRDSKDIVDFFDWGVALVRRRTGGERFVEKTPHHILKLPWILAHFPKAHVIHIVRDGRDCFCSSKHHPNIPQRTVTHFARYWRKCVRVGARHKGAPNLFTIRYEDLVASPESTLGTVMAFLGLPVESRQLNPQDLGDEPRAQLARFSRLKAPISSETVGRWKSELSPRDVEQFDRVAGKELRLYGYS